MPPRAARAHALKNCLNVVAAVTKLVESELDGAARERLGRAKDAIRRMVAIIEEDLVAENGASPLSDAKFVSAETIMQAVTARVQDRAEAAGVELFVRCGPGGVRGDRDSLVEAVGNVLLNAIEATPEGGAVFVGTDETSDGGQLWTVQDMGSGIPHEAFGRIGTPFSSRRQGGSGLGLALTRDVVERHGGLAQIESAPGSGTLVSIWLPASA